MEVIMRSSVIVLMFIFSLSVSASDVLEGIWDMDTRENSSAGILTVDFTGEFTLFMPGKLTAADCDIYSLGPELLEERFSYKMSHFLACNQSDDYNLIFMGLDNKDSEMGFNFVNRVKKSKFNETKNEGLKVGTHTFLEGENHVEYTLDKEGYLSLFVKSKGEIRTVMSCNPQKIKRQNPKNAKRISFDKLLFCKVSHINSGYLNVEHSVSVLKSIKPKEFSLNPITALSEETVPEAYAKKLK